ncbi:NACHT domain-containing protein [Actinomadura sp. NPDC048955]|uniref:NACHT domain-containing protein n=1 Tax=Actinomadura sp. NPDC048955 TaxID=3158228 RepID=UPI0033F20ED1
MLVVAGLLVWMFAAWRGEGGLQTSANVAQLVGVLLAVPAVVVGLVVWWWRHRGPAPVPDAETVAAAKEALAVMVAAQWREEARIRELDDPAPIPVRWELTTDPRIMDHPAHITVGGGALTWSGTGDRIAAMAGEFKALRRRRLVIIGGPGAGKTTLAVQLVRELLAHLDPGDPVPLLVSVASWDTNRFPRLQAWLAARLTEIYPSLRAPQYGLDAADQLVQRAHILPVLDGLDEIPAQARTAVIAALNRSLADDDQLILTSRTREFTDAALARDVLTSAAVIQPQPLTASAAADYLASCLPPLPPPAWIDALQQIRTGGAAHLTEMVSTPLGLWLLRTTHITTRADPTSVTDPTRFPTAAALQAHLFDLLIPAVIITRPPSTDPANLFRPRRHHDPAQATRWLSYLAHLLDTVPTRDLAWWRLAATSHTLTARIAWLGFITLAGGLAGALAGVLAVRYVGGNVGGQYGWIPVWHVGGLVGGLGEGFVVGAGAVFWAQESPGYANLKTTGRKTLLAYRLADNLWFGLGQGLLAGFGFWLMFGAAIGLRVGLGIVLVYGLGFGLIRWAETPAVTGGANTPVSTWRADRTLNLLRICTGGLVFGLVSGLVIGLRFGLGFGLVLGLVIGLGFGLGAGVMVGHHHAWLAFLAVTFELAWQRRLPRSLMAFLDDAHRLGLLRTVGPVYQFRHAELHDHLAAAYTAQEDR